MDASYITIPFDVPEVFGTKAQVKVCGTIDDYTFRGSLAPMGGGRHVMVIRKEIRHSIRKTFGEEVTVKLQLDLEPRTVFIPTDLEEMLQRNPELKMVFDKMSYSHRKEYVQWITEAKKTETRLRRLEKALEMLQQKPKPAYL